MQNPFTLTFGQKPLEMIPRDEQLSTIMLNFDDRVPVSHIYMIVGVRGSGKTVMLSQLSELYKKKDSWIVINLSSGSDIIETSISEISRLTNSLLKKADITASLDLGIGAVSMTKNALELSAKSVLKMKLQELTDKGKHVLFLLDEVTNNEYIKEFSEEFQIWLREKYSVFLVMAGLYNNINNLQNENTLTFLYRAPKIMLGPLDIPSIAARYKKIFEISIEDAAAMAKLTKGYSFAFQILGDLAWRKGCYINNIIDDYDALLSSYAYEKIWFELSEKDKEVCKIIAKGTGNIGEIKEKMGVSSQYINAYRKRLIERGIIKRESYGIVSFELPRFETYINLYAI